MEEFEKANNLEIEKKLMQIDSPADFELGALWGAKWMAEKCADRAKQIYPENLCKDDECLRIKSYAADYISNELHHLSQALEGRDEGNQGGFKFSDGDKEIRSDSI